jgi:hypothetical protein
MYLLLDTGSTTAADVFTSSFFSSSTTLSEGGLDFSCTFPNIPSPELMNPIKSSSSSCFLLLQFSIEGSGFEVFISIFLQGGGKAKANGSGLI